MQATGPTHGLFYNHFPSKKALMAEGVEHGLRSTLVGVEQVGNSPRKRAEYLDRYHLLAALTLGGRKDNPQQREPNVSSR